MEVTKVKYQGEVVIVHRMRYNGTTEEKLTLECGDAPNKSFFDAMRAVEADVLNRSGLKTKTFEKAFALTGVSVAKDKHGHRLFSLSATLQFGYGPAFGIALPLLREKVEDEGGETVLSNIECKHIVALLDEGNQYAEGARVQGELPLGSEAQG